MKLKLVDFEKDELLFSWVYRMAYANNLRYKALYNVLFTEKEISVVDLNNQFFLDAMSKIDVVKDMDQAKLFLDTSLYCLVAMGLTMENQQKLIVKLFRKDISFNEKRFRSIVVGLKLCPRCLEEAEEKGLKHGVAYRSHQADGVSVCYKHACNLKKYKFTNEYMIHREVRLHSKYLLEDAEHEIPEELRLVYAKAVNELLKSNFDIDFDDVKSIFTKRLILLGYKGLFDSKFFGDFWNSKYSSVCKKVTVTKALFSACSISYRRIIAFSLFLYNGDFDRFIHDIQDYISQREVFAFKGVKHLGEERALLNEYECLECGKVFVQNDKGVAIGISCPECASGNVRFYSAFENIYPDYKYSESRDGYVHKECGTFINSSDFLFNRSRCNCIIAEIKDGMKNYPDFELVSYNTTDDIVVIRHKNCGNVFSINYKYFFKYPFCRICNWTTGKHNFGHKVREVVGDEYTVIGEYKKASLLLKMRHNVCGKEFDITPYAFLLGGRCPDCSTRLQNIYLSEIVKKLTSGRYSFTAKPMEVYGEIVDNVTGMKQRILCRLLQQELLRPTPSSIVVLSDLEEKARKTLLQSDLEKEVGLLGNFAGYVYSHLIKKYSPDDLIFVEEIELSGCTRKKIIKGIEKLYVTKKLRRIVTGVYVFGTNNKEYSAEELVYNKYICRNGRIIGRYIDYAAGERRIESIMVSAKKYQKYYFAGLVLRIRGIKEI